MKVSAWFFIALIVGPALIGAGFARTSFDGWVIAPAVVGFLIAVAAMIRFVRDMNSADFHSKGMRAEEKLSLIDQGVSNPVRHIKKNPDLVQAFEALATELGIDLNPATNVPMEHPHRHHAALLLLSGRVAASDSHLIVAALDRGIVDPEQIAAVVDEMKSNGSVLSEGAL